MRASRFVAVLLGLGILSACSPDYGAVRDWAIRAEDVVRPAGAAIARNDPAPPPAELRDGVEAMREAAAAWLGALALLAEDGFLRDRENPLTPLVARIRPLDEAGALAAESLGDTMAYMARRIWRAPELAYAVERGDPAFQALLAALGRQSERLALATPDPRDRIAARYAALLAARPPPGARAALDDVRALREEAAARDLRAREARHAAIARVAEGHALLNERKRRLSQAETARLLRAQDTELRRLAALAEGH
jgi:hypothetical protein